MKTILAIDDEKVVLMCIQAVLQRQGYTVLTTDDPHAGLRILKEQPVDLLILDVRMPTLDGLKVCEEIKVKREQGIPILFITGLAASFSADSDSVAKLWQTAFSDGTVDILYKPFDIDSLAQKVVSLIGGASDEPEK